MIVCSVREGYPDETGHVDQREREIMDAWRDLQRKADERKKQLSDAEQQQRFNEQARDLVSSDVTSATPSNSSASMSRRAIW